MAQLKNCMLVYYVPNLKKLSHNNIEGTAPWPPIGAAPQVPLLTSREDGVQN